MPLGNAYKPYSPDDMVKCAEELSKGIPFVRVDFYEVDKKTIFGEMTFSPESVFSYFNQNKP